MRRIALTALGFALLLSAVPLFSQMNATVEKALESNEKPANNSTIAEIGRKNRIPMAGSIDDFGRSWQSVHIGLIFERVSLTFRPDRLDKVQLADYLSN